MTTAIDICNNALDLIGQGLHITSLDEQSKEADLCRRNYQLAFDRVVTRYNFSFLKKKATINTTASCTANAFSYAYAVPSDFLRSLFAVKSSNLTERIEYSIVNENGSQILCTNEKAPFILNYITNTASLKALSPIMIEAVEYYLASRFVTSLAHGTSSLQVSQYLLEQSNKLVEQAYILDADQNTKDENYITTICNNALALAGNATQITSLEESTKESNLLRVNFQQSIDFCLSRFNFDFLYKKVNLTTSNAVTYALNKYKYAYKLPTDFSKPLFIDSTTGAEFTVISLNNDNVICTNQVAPFNFNYVTKTIDLKAIPNKIVEAIEYYLASRLVSVLGGNSTTQDQQGNAVQSSQMLLTRCDQLLTDYYSTQNVFITDSLKETEICNKALSLTGYAEKVTSIYEISKTASLLQENFQQSIDFCFKAYPFSFLFKTCVISLQDKISYSLNDYKNAYKLPTDFNLGLFISDKTKNQFSTILLNNSYILLTDKQAPFTFVYLQKSLPLSAVPTELLEAIEYYLASRIIDSVKQNAQITDNNGEKIQTKDQLVKIANSILKDLYEKQVLSVTDELKETDVVNTALSLVGNFSISSLEEKTKLGLLCKNNYSNVLQGLLSQGNFSFNRKDEVITKDNLTDIVSLPYRYTYTIPSDVLKVLYIDDLNNRLEKIHHHVSDFNFRVQGKKRYLVTNKQAPFVIQYQSTCDDLSLLSPAFLLAFQYILAAQLATALVTTEKQSNSLQVNLAQQGQVYLNLAIGQDAQQGADSIQDNYCSFIEGRNGF